MKRAFVGLMLLLVSAVNCFAGVPVQLSETQILPWITTGTMEGTVTTFDAEGVEEVREFRVVTDGISTRQDTHFRLPEKYSDFSTVTNKDGTQTYSEENNSFIYDLAYHDNTFYSTLSAGRLPTGTREVTWVGDQAILANTNGTREFRSFKLQASGLPKTVSVILLDHDDKLISGRLYEFTKVTTKVNAHELVLVPANGNIVEYVIPGLKPGSTVLYEETGTLNTSKLLAKKLEYDRLPKPGNCATASIMAASALLGVEPKSTSFRGNTSLASVADALATSSLYTLAATFCLDEMEPSDVVLIHLPVKNHFVVLAGVTEHEVWGIDLSSKRFLFSLSKDQAVRAFGRTHNGLVISNEPITRYAAMAANPDDLIGATPSPGSCTKKWWSFYMQDCLHQYWMPCVERDPVIIYDRYRCEDSETEYCVDNQHLVWMSGWDCYEHPSLGCMIDFSFELKIWNIFCK